MQRTLTGLVFALAFACDGAENVAPDGTGGGSGSGGGPAVGGGAGAGGSATGGVGASGGSVTAGTGGAGTGGAQAGSGSATGGSGATGGAGASAGTGAGGSGGTATAGNAGSATAGTAGASGGTAGSGGGSPNGARFPFPANRRSERCVYPAAADPEDARRAYQAWKDEIVTADGAGGHLRTRRPNSPGAETNSTVSEGIAYGMMIAVAMDDQTLFDELWKYSQLWLNGNGLMNWYINAAGTAPLDTGGATDSDEDIAWALVMADRQWGGQGSLDEPYLSAAIRQINAVLEHEVDDTDMILAGDEWGDNRVFNPSYFTPNEYRVFAEVTGNDRWNDVIDRGYEILAASLNQASGNAENGLAPAWCDASGVPKVPFDGGPTHYQYDSARVPFRIGVDYCESGDPRAAAYLVKISGFFAGIGAANIVDGYDLDGSERPDPDSDPNGPQSAVFIGGAAVGGMHDDAFQTLVNEGYELVATGELLARSRYYNHSWTTLSLLMMSGNLTSYPPR